MSRWSPAANRASIPVVVVVVVVVGSSLVAGCGSDPVAVDPGAVGRPVRSAPPELDGVEAVEEGLASCADVVLLEPEPDGLPAGPISLDQRVLGVLADYTSSNEAAFAGLWLDARYGGAPMVAFAGDIGRHRTAILDLLSSDGRAGMPFGIVEARYSEPELAVVVERLTAGFSGHRESVLRSAAIDKPRNRVAVELLDPDNDDLDLILQLAATGAVCGEVSTTAAVPGGALDVLPRDGAVKLLSCGESPFPESALSDPVPIRVSDHPAAALVARSTGDSAGAGADSAAALDGDWIVLDIGADRALFGLYDGELEATATATRSGSAWAISGWSFGCELRVGLPAGLGAVEVFLDPVSPPGPDRRVIRVLVSELACAGGRPMGKRLLGPQVLESEMWILLAFAVAAGPDEPGDCPGNPMTSVTIELDAPLGTRTVMNGMHLPPRPITDP